MACGPDGIISHYPSPQIEAHHVLRNRKPQPQDGFLRYEVLPRINVGLFFCLLAIFGEITVPGTFEDRVSFFLSLFGVKAS